MTKAELLRALEPFMDETEIIPWIQGNGEGELLNVHYMPPQGKGAAFAHLVVRSPAQPTGDT